MPRLRKIDVLIDSIQNGLKSDEYFAYAEGITDEGCYLSPKSNQSTEFYIDANGYLVRPEAAKAQIEKERNTTSSSINYPDGNEIISDPDGHSSIAEDHKITKRASGDAASSHMIQRKKPKRFHAAVKLNTSRIGRDAGRIAEEIIQHLSLLSGAKVDVTMEIHAEIADGIPDNIVRTVTENCRTLKFTSFDFEEE